MTEPASPETPVALPPPEPAATVAAGLPPEPPRRGFLGMMVYIFASGIAVLALLGLIYAAGCTVIGLNLAWQFQDFSLVWLTFLFSGGTGGVAWLVFVLVRRFSVFRRRKSS